MPSLTKAAREQLLGPMGRFCPTCRVVHVRHYCRSCDEFFATCQCAPPDTTHDAHRVYLWTPHGIIARPDFDLT